MKKISDEQAAYLAGFLEGEGCFFVANPRKQRNALVSVNQKSPEVLHYIQEITGVGHIERRIRSPRPPSSWEVGGNPIYFWRTHKQKEVIPFIRRILPYLINKRTRKRAKCVLYLLRSRVKYNRNGRKNLPRKVEREARLYKIFETTMVRNGGD